MFDKLIEQLERPEVYRENSEAFWNDEHISKQLLEAHLNPNFEGASRNHEFIEKSIEWIGSQVVGDNVKILDLGCGPGLYSLPLAQRGWVVTGIDFSEGSIRYAKQKSKEVGCEIRYEFRDYLTIDFENEFDLVLLIYCDFAVLAPEKRKILVEKIFRAMKPGGKLILDVFSASNYKNRREEQTWEMNPKGGFWNEDSYFCLTGLYEYENNVFLDQYMVMTEKETKVYYMWNQAFSAETLQDEFSGVSFSKINYYGDVSGSLELTKSNTLCVVVEK